MTTPGSPSSSWQGSAYNLTDYRIEATDGEIGKVDEATYDIGASYLVVDTGPWIFGRKLVLPAGVVSALDHENQRVMLDRTREQIKNAPEFDAGQMADPEYLHRIESYYAEGGPGWQAPGQASVQAERAL